MIDQTAAMLAESRRKSMLQYVSEGASVADLDAAGYTLDEISILPNVNTTSLVNSSSYNRDRQGVAAQTPKPAVGTQDTLEAFTPTTRDNWREGIRQGASALGINDQAAQFYAGRIAGTGGNMGLLDMTGLGVIPGVQEGVQQAERGYKTDNKLDMAMGALGVGLNVLAAVPGGKLVAKGVTKATENVAEGIISKAPTLYADAIGNAKALAQGDLEFMRGRGLPQDTVGVGSQVTGQTGDQTFEALGEVTAAKPKPNKNAPKTVPTFKAVNTNKPDAIFGTRTIKDMFPEDAGDSAWNMGDETNWQLPEDDFIPAQNTYDVEKLGYSRNIYLHDLANIKLGRDTPENVLEQYGNDVTPETLEYITSRLKRLDNDPDFADYVSKLEKSPNFNIYDARDELDIERYNKGRVTFRSPIPELLDAIDFPKKGMEGYQIISTLRSNPSIRKAELDSVLPEIDPKVRYSKEEAKQLFADNLWDVKVKENSKWGAYQRQVDLKDGQTEYNEFTVEASRPRGSTFIPNKRHYAPETLAHTRMSFRIANDTGEEYALVEELQTDLVQGGYKEPQTGIKRVTPSSAVESLKDTLTKEYGLDDFELNLLKVKAHDTGDYRYEFGAHPYIRKAVEASSVPKADHQAIINSIMNSDRPFDNLLALRSGMGTNEYFDTYDKLTDLYHEKIEPKVVYAEKPTVSAPPIKTLNESVRLLLGTLMAKSANKGVTRIVIPPVERLAEARFPDLGQGYLDAINPKNSFYKTYVTEVQKVLKDFETEFGRGNFNSRPKDLNYRVKKYVDDFTGMETELPVTGTEIDFTGLVKSGVDLRKIKFAEGGLVGYAQGGTVEDEQMNRLMQEGGMADAGVAQEPVTGNEVPPGALPSEVRDDVPVQLSEGEYVVPADVLRFFGVRFFEDLRNQAKQGMAEMQSNGRIGGASVDSNGVPAEDDDELTPEEEQMLQAAMGSQEAPTGMAEGGVVPFDRSKFTLGDTSGRESRKYIDPTTGVTQVFQFLMGSPVTPIPSNFVPWTQELETAAAAKPTTPTIKTPPVAPVRSDRESTMAAPTGAAPADGGGINYNNWAEKNYDKITSNPYQFGLDALTDDSGKFASKGLGIAGLATGVLPLAFLGMGAKAANKMQNIAEASAALKLMEAKGLSGSADYTNLQKVIGIATDALPSAQQLLVEKHMAATGNNYVKAIEGMQGKAAPAVAPTTPTVAAPKTSTGSGSSSTVSSLVDRRESEATAKAKTVPQQPTIARSSGIAASPSNYSNYTSAGTGNSKPVTSVVSTPSGPKTVIAPKSPAKTVSGGKEKDTGRRATGGLITRPTKK